VSSGSRPAKGINIVHRDFCPSTLVPRGLVVEEATLDGCGARIIVRAMAKASVCPGYGKSKRVHSDCGNLTLEGDAAISAMAATTPRTSAHSRSAAS
jgi:hypothetical protein